MAISVALVSTMSAPAKLAESSCRTRCRMVSESARYSSTSMPSSSSNCGTRMSAMSALRDV